MGNEFSMKELAEVQYKHFGREGESRDEFLQRIKDVFKDGRTFDSGIALLDIMPITSGASYIEVSSDLMKAVGMSHPTLSKND